MVRGMGRLQRTLFIAKRGVWCSRVFVNRETLSSGQSGFTSLVLPSRQNSPGTQ